MCFVCHMCEPNRHSLQVQPVYPRNIEDSSLRSMAPQQLKRLLSSYEPLRARPTKHHFASDSDCFGGRERLRQFHADISQGTMHLSCRWKKRKASACGALLYHDNVLHAERLPAYRKRSKSVFSRQSHFQKPPSSEFGSVINRHIFQNPD